MKQEIKERIERIRKGEVPEGYKETKVGIIPDDWNNKKLIQIADYVDYRGKTPQKTNGGVFLVTARNIKNGYIDYEASKEFVSEKKYLDIMSRGLPKLGDVLITTEAPVGNVAQIDRENIALAQRVIKYRGKKDEIDNTYMKFYFLGFKFQKEISIESTGGTVQGIKGSRLHKISIPFPKIIEQEKIAEILSTWDKAIELKENLIEEKKEFKRGLTQKLLTGEIRFPEFTDDWEETRLEKKLTFIKKETLENPQNYKLLKVKLHLKGIEATENCPNPTENGRPYHLRSEGELLIGRQNFHNGGIGIIPKGMNGYIASNAISSLKPSDENLMFYYYYLSSPNFYKKVGHLIGGTGQKEISESMFKNLKIKLPSNDKEIKKIGETIKTVHKDLETETNILSQLKEQKRGLMQLLLTGIVRVEVD